MNKYFIKNKYYCLMEGTGFICLSAKSSATSLLAEDFESED
jgi:hypothetical protein